MNLLERYERAELKATILNRKLADLAVLKDVAFSEYIWWKWERYEEYLRSRIIRRLQDADVYEAALKDMVMQFAGEGKKPNSITTYGLSALEHAFSVLDWDDPHCFEDQP